MSDPARYDPFDTQEKVRLALEVRRAFMVGDISTMRLASRPPLARMLFIDNELSSIRWPNCRTLAHELEVNPRTIRRDIEYMRDQLEAPIEFDTIKNGYFYASPTYRLRFLKLTEGELVSILVAEKVMRQYRGTPYGADLTRAFGKITAALNDPILTDKDRLSDAISFRTAAPALFEVSVLQTLLTAIVQRRSVVIDYWAPSRNTQESRKVDPYHIAACDGQYYLFAHCHSRNALRQFVPARIRAIELTETVFERPDSFQVDDYLSGSLAVFGCGRNNPRTVKLRFTGQSVHYIRERLWHPTQQFETTPDGDLLVTFEVSHLREVERLVLTWAPECEALEPPELRAKVAQALSAAAKVHRRSKRLLNSPARNESAESLNRVPATENPGSIDINRE